MDKCRTYGIEQITHFYFTVITVIAGKYFRITTITIKGNKVLVKVRACGQRKLPVPRHNANASYNQLYVVNSLPDTFGDNRKICKKKK